MESKLTNEMKLKLDKIDILVEKGYKVKIKKENFIPILISPEGNFVNIFFRKRYGDDSLPGFSWIAFFFPPIIAAKIRDWKYFWSVGLMAFGLSIIESIFNIETSYTLSFLISLVYGFGYPLRRWLFVKSNKKEFGISISVLLGLLLSFVTAIPAGIVYEVFSR